MHRILVLKGGGLRGLLQLPALELFETHFNKPICEIFDLIVGSSVGSITGGILATGNYPVSKYNDLFYDTFQEYSIDDLESVYYDLFMIKEILIECGEIYFLMEI